MGTGNGLVGSVLMGLVAVGCGSTDYARMDRYYEQEPRTILVLPARSQEPNREACRYYVATIGKPLIERGYYVLPVGVTEEILRRRPEFTNQGWDDDPGYLGMVFGADAVLYVTIEQWDPKNSALATTVTVQVDLRLVDTESGRPIWREQGVEIVQSSSGAGSGDVVSALLVCVISAAITARTDRVPLAMEANRSALAHLPPGVYHPDYRAVRDEIQRWKQKR